MPGPLLQGLATRPPRWHRVYFVLAAIDLVTIVVGLGLGHISRTNYEASVELNRGWADKISQFSSLGPAAIAVNEPGNNVFLTADPVRQQQLLDLAHREFRSRLDELKQSIGHAPHQWSTTNPDSFVNELDRIAGFEVQMHAHATAVLDHFAAGDENAAASFMALMDADLVEIQSRVTSLVQGAQAKQLQALSRQYEEAASLWIGELVVGIAFVLIVCGVLWYGHLLGKKFVATQQHGQRLETFLIQTIESSPNGILLVDEQGVIRHANPALAKTFGYRPDELIGLRLNDLVPERIRADHDGLVRKYLANGVTRPMGDRATVTGITKGGNTIDLEVGLASVQHDGETLALATVTDVSTRLQLEELNQRHTRLLHALTDAQDQFIDGVNPQELLTTVLAYALELTESELGFIAETVPIEDGASQLKLHAVTNFHFLPNAEEFYAQHAPPNLTFTRLDNLFGRAVLDQKVVIANNAASDPRAKGLPAGHPPINNFVGIPVMRGSQVVGALCLANAPGDYSQDIVKLLSPFLSTCATFIEAWKVKRANEQADVELRRTIDHLAEARADVEQKAIELEHKAAELATAKALADRANQAKSDFLANMSHEIRTPMTSILGYTDMLLEDGSDINADSQKEMLCTIKRNGKHLLTLINDILDLSKIEAGGMTLENIEVDPFSILRDVHNLMQERARSKGLKFSVINRGPLPAGIQCDPTRLKQILLNLVGNAVKFTSEGEVTLTARWIADAPGYLAFDVTDSGIGMSPVQSSALFKPFSQADTSTTRKFGGTGLGLTISRRLARAMGGDVIVLSSEPGKGTTFRATIRADERAAMRLVDEPPAAKSAGTESFAAKLPAGMRILLAEDSPDSQRLIQFVLRKAGADVTIVENGKEAYEDALARMNEGNPYDVILMDMQMPVMDGLAATSSLREAGYGWPIVALTANAMESDRQKSLEAGCNEHALKPIDRPSLFATLWKYADDKQQDDMQQTGMPA